MEKPETKKKNKILKIIPKAAQAAAASLRNFPFSPRRDNRPDVTAHRLKTHHSKGFSGPIVSMIPAEARRKPKNFETQEPTSPKVSCMGQIKHGNKMSNNKHVSLPKESKPDSFPQPEKSKKSRQSGPGTESKKKPSGVKKIFRRKAGSSTDQADPVGSAPSMSQMKKFASSRDTFANFDWTTAQIAPEDDRGFYSDGERGYSDGEDDVVVPFSAPIIVAGGGGVAGLDLAPRKEINLWERRTTARTAPLQLNREREN